jgi:hypothetical protein
LSDQRVADQHCGRFNSSGSLANFHLKDSVIGRPIGSGRDRDQCRSLLMLDPLILYIFAGCVVILALGMAAIDLS